MRLPGAENASVDDRKITTYLLSERHPVGRHKAAVFNAVGYNQDNWHSLADALRRLAVDSEVSRVEDLDYGQRFIIDGALDTPSGAPLFVRTIWFVENDSIAPRFVTAYPLRRR